MASTQHNPTGRAPPTTQDWALEFSGTVDGLHVKGVDLITVNSAGKITSIEVLIRPLNALQRFFEQMGAKVMQELQRRHAAGDSSLLKLWGASKGTQQSRL